MNTCKMKDQRERNFTNEIVIKLSRFQVTEYYTNPNTLLKWFYQDDTAKMFMKLSFEHIDGTPWQPGAKTIFRQTKSVGVRGMSTRSYTTEMIHTVIKNNLPDEFVFSIEDRGVFTTSYNFFKKEAPNVTRWISQNKVDITGIPKILRNSAMRKIRGYSRRIMRRFKKHAQRAYASRN